MWFEAVLSCKEGLLRERFDGKHMIESSPGYAKMVCIFVEVEQRKTDKEYLCVSRGRKKEGRPRIWRDSE